MKTFSKLGDQKLLQELNRTLVLNTIHHYGSTSRIEISKLTKLSQSTVSNVVDGLQKEGILVEAGTGSSTKAGGRKPTILTIRPGYAYMLAVGIVTEAFHITVQLSLFDLRLQIVEKTELELAETGVELIRSIKDIVREFIEHHAEKKILGIGFSVPTVLNREGVMFRGHLLGLENFPLEQELSAAFPTIPVVVEQEQHAAVLGERTMGAVKDIENLIYITVGRGIGSSMIVNGQLVRGEYGGAGEIGHMSINKYGEKCICGKMGCLRLYATELSFIKKIKEAVTHELPVPLTVYNPAIDKINVLEVYTEAVRGDSFCRSLVEGMLDDLCTAISNLVYLFNPKKIILGGNLLLAKELAIPRIAERLNEMVDSPASMIEIEAAQLGTQSSLYGVASLLLDKHFLNKDLLMKEGG
ncbi:ROK family transcriptional regulator [Xylanibacillus composti]|uniref:Transcriptional regulator n=1 Tax=Xylanibacillus composti TaxID=1572762 RepID=A0A8J4H5C5_9BACL|nr:ROK family transcriptional regulator [Xylanibacillus composti]MDT9726047.1 ROK family transcriptional regulator [Xylanibacillus composti]GIQ68808.1 transcriptional regulator [Xylanibacillus composti]